MSAATRNDMNQFTFLLFDVVGFHRVMMVCGSCLIVVHIDIMNLLIELATIRSIYMKNDLRWTGVSHLVFDIIRLLNVATDLVMRLEFRFRID